MTLDEARDRAREWGWDDAEELVLLSGETVYLLVGEGMIGLPRYIHDVGGLALLSTDEESMALFDEPAYLDEGADS